VKGETIVWKRTQGVIHAGERIPAAQLLARLGRRISKLRKSRRWTRHQLARRLGVPITRLGRWEQGTCQPPLPMLLELGRYLEVSIEDLALGGEAKTDE
jgi:transcriptional regulator with XRE-family HTH domain